MRNYVVPLVLVLGVVLVVIAAVGLLALPTARSEEVYGHYPTGSYTEIVKGATVVAYFRVYSSAPNAEPTGWAVELKAVGVTGAYSIDWVMRCGGTWGAIVGSGNVEWNLWASEKWYTDATFAYTDQRDFTYDEGCNVALTYKDGPSEFGWPGRIGWTSDAGGQALVVYGEPVGEWPSDSGYLYDCDGDGTADSKVPCNGTHTYLYDCDGDGEKESDVACTGTNDTTPTPPAGGGFEIPAWACGLGIVGVLLIAIVAATRRGRA